MRVALQVGGATHYGAQKGGADAVGNLAAQGVGEITLKNMHHHIGDAAGCLIPGQTESQLGVHERETGAQDVGIAHGNLVHAVEARNHRVAAAFAAGGGDGEHHAHGESLLRKGLAAVKVPEITLVGHAQGNGFGGVYYRAAAHGHYDVYAGFAANFYAFIHAVVGGIGVDAFERYGVYAGLLQAAEHFLPYARFARRRMAAAYQRAAAKGRRELADLLFYAAAEDVIGGETKGEVFH